VSDAAGGMRIAVVITFHGEDRFLPEAVASVLNQSRPPDEIVVVDDASPPESAGPLLELDPRVRVIRHPANRGTGAARQTGSDATSAELIAYLDADDAWLPDKLERQAAILTGRPDVAAVHTALLTVHRDGRETSFLQKPAVLDLPTQLWRNQALPSALLIRRAVLAAVGGWTLDRRLMEDWDLNTRIVAAGHKVVFLPEPLVRFRRTGHGNLSSRGWAHTRILLQTIWHHRRLYRATLGLRGALAAFGAVLQREGLRGTGFPGRLFRLAGRALGSSRAETPPHSSRPSP
jgi:glycosyltransferase involved in cell wall biosynthesis